MTVTEVLWLTPPHLLFGELLVCKQFINVPVVLKAPGKEAGHAATATATELSTATATAAATPTATATPTQLSTARGPTTRPRRS